MKFCSKCGAQLADDAAFCPKCGTPCPTSPAQPEPTFSAPAPLDVPPEDLLSSESLPPLEGESEVMPTGEAAPAAGKKSFLDTIKAWSKKRKIITGAVAAVVVVAAVVSIGLLRGSVFDRLVSDILDKYPYANNARAADGSYLKLDTNPRDQDVDDLTQAEYTVFKQTQDDTVKAIQFANKELGFSSSVYDQMMETTALMGMQSEENGKYRVSWSYHPNKGLEVRYEKK